jgi:hypothetical protein
MIRWIKACTRRGDCWNADQQIVIKRRAETLQIENYGAEVRQRLKNNYFGKGLPNLTRVYGSLVQDLTVECAKK